MRKKVQQIATFTIRKKSTSQSCSSFQLVLSKGSILDFQHPKGAIVNAANEGCLGGGGVDGAISDAGGRQLLQDRIALPKIQSKTGDCIRCLTGDAAITGPNQYGTIGTPYVIHAVGPAYYMYDAFDEPDNLLSKAYGNAMQRAKEAQVEAVGFSLLSAGVFRGSRSRVGVLRLGIEAICCFDVHPELAEVHLFAFTQMEVDALLRAAELMKLTQDECMIR
jgi:O-acetyl-ADP-ribose deacetylase (regulator of RNase III)